MGRERIRKDPKLFARIKLPKPLGVIFLHLLLRDCLQSVVLAV